MQTITKLDDAVVKDIQKLISLNIDASKGYSEAADNCDSPYLASEFRNIAKDRRIHTIELQSIVGLNDEDPKESGSVRGAIHRGWMELRNLVSSQETEAMLKEVERGEKVLVENYENTLKEHGDSPAGSVLRRQCNEVRANLGYASLKRAACEARN